MNLLFLVLASINVVIWVFYGLLFFCNLKNKPIFRGNDCYNNKIIYPSLSVIIPACNEEESIEQAVRQLISQDYSNLEVILVNDRSTDNTGTVLEKLKVQYPQLKVITIYDLPPNWLGKNHAVYQGVKEATGEWLLFTDADVMFSLGSLKKTLSYALEHTLDHLTIASDLYYGGVFYRAFLTYLSFAITATVMFTNKVGIGAFNLVKKSVYQEIGGYEAIAMRVADDMSFEELVINKGYKQDFGLSGKGFIIVKWYDNLFALLKGIKKNQFAHFKYSVVTTLVICLYALLVGVYPFVGIFLGPIWARALCGISVISLFAVYNYLAKYLNISRSYVVIHPISVLLYIGAILNSMVKTISQGGIEWRGTPTSLGNKKAVEGILNYKNTSQSNGRLLGCWKVEVGPIGPDCLLILREFDNSEDLLEEREKFLLNNNPFGIGDVLKGFKVESFMPFHFMPPIKSGQLGPIYEFREYQLAVGGIKKSIDAWEKALPARQKISPVVMAMYALDGPARIFHIIAYESFEFRLNVRQELYQKGIWPPKGAAEEIIKATNMIALPTSISQLT